jgi:predicted metal-dependent enzyme (double-stranded beta helix superfamily)
VPAARDLVVEELRSLAAWLGERPELWRQHVRHDPGQRVFHRLVADAHVTVWLVCWMPGHDTGFHDHDGAAGAVAVLQGEVTEQRLALGSDPVPRLYGPGSVLTFDGADIHRVQHHGDAPAVTIHAYSPALRRMGVYEVSADGRLLRHALDEDSELRPVETPVAA